MANHFSSIENTRKTERRTAVNLILAFAISGIWHGAAYNFAVWGLWHGLLLVGHRVWRTRFPRAAAAMPDAVAIACTFLLVNLGWAFFCMDMGRALYALSRIVRWA